MVIEIDRKRIAKAKKSYRWLIIIYVLLIGVYSMNFFIGEPSIFELWNFSIYLLIILIYWYMMRQFKRHMRTDHHLYLDEAGLTMAYGHTRVDIPWSDIDKISCPWRFQGANEKAREKHTQLYFKLHLRPDSAYDKRAYRIYNVYDMDIHLIYRKVDELWTQGQHKMTLLS